MVIYIFIAHILGWFVLGALLALLRSKPGEMGNALTMWGAVYLGICSAILQLTLKKIGLI